ncbi:E1_E4 [Trematomus bernacchii papillomavirus]|nr:E1_E4 [Trematomus bernacchii papillomavirus]
MAAFLSLEKETYGQKSYQREMRKGFIGRIKQRRSTTILFLNRRRRRKLHLPPLSRAPRKLNPLLRAPKNQSWLRYSNKNALRRALRVNNS